MHTRALFWVVWVASPIGVVAGVLGACSGELDAVPQDAGDDAAACASGTIRFRFVSTASDQFCIGAPTSCTATWLSIRKDTGEELVIDRPCVPDCSSCEPIGCPASCAAPSQMRAGGVAGAWDGTKWSSSVCGTGAACVARSCANAGRYFAKMCAYREIPGDAAGSFCNPTTTATCTEVGFDWPPANATTEVLGVIRGDGGAECCPADWQLVACNGPDGGAGWNCHNPLLRCPSSTTCGEGCDFAVVGRCAE